MNKLTTLLLFAPMCFIFSCENKVSNTDTELKTLRSENDSLKTELARLRSLPEACEVSPMTFFKNTNIKKGEEAELYVSMAKVFHDKLPDVIIWNEDTQTYSDTFPFKFELGSFEYIKFPATKKGTNWIKGKVRFECGGVPREVPFESAFIVE